MNSIRRRFVKSEIHLPSDMYFMFNNREISLSDEKLGLVFWLSIGIFFTVVCYIGSNSSSSCSLVTTPSTDLKQFQEKSARHLLKTMTKIGPRIVGSYENEHYAQRLIMDYLSNYANRQFGPLFTNLSHQVSDRGNFSLHFLETDFVSSYENIQNIVFRISTSKYLKKSAVLINCHYDSFMNSPAAGDDFINCAVMMDVIRVLLERKEFLLNDVIFLFNGAEENILQASHAFVTQHKWAKDCKVVINLDAGGSQGRQALFQVSSLSRWILTEYRNIIDNPLTSVVGQEVFESGLIPSDTDFRIFNQFGIPGVDLAFIKNGYLYHTPFDTHDKFSEECLQLSGNNLVAFVRVLANSSYVSNPPSEDVHSRSVFFDFLGYFVFLIPDNWYYFGTFLIIFSVIVQTVQFVTKLKILRMFFVLLLVELSSLVGMIVISLFIGACHHLFLIRMAWYNHHFVLIFQFLCPIVCFVMYFRNFMFIKFDLYRFDAELIRKLSFYCVFSIYSIILFIANYFAILSFYLVSIWIIFPFISLNLFPHFWGLVSKVLNARHSNNYRLKELLFSVIAYGTPLLHHSQIFQELLDVFMPISGRAGPLVLPDVLVGIVVVFYCLFPLSYLASYFTFMRSKFYFIARFCLLLVSIFSLIIVNFSSIGFPYGNDRLSPRPQRIISFDMTRIIRDRSNNVIKKDNGLVILSLDSNSLHYLSKKVDFLSDYHKYRIPCFDLPYCGVSHFFPVAHLFTDMYYIPTSHSHTASPFPHLTIVNKSVHRHFATLSINVTGPAHNNIFIMTRHGVTLTKWSLDPDNPPKPSLVSSNFRSNHYFIYNSYGLQPQNPFNVVLYFIIDSLVIPKDRIVEIALSATYSHKIVDELSPALKQLKLLLPDWVAFTYTAGSYNHFSINLH